MAIDEIDVVQFVQRAIKERKVVVLDVLEHNALKNMEQYRELMGELSALNYLSQELSNLLEKQELIDD